MDPFLARYGDRVTATLACFDRLLLKGTIRTLSYTDGMARWLNWKRVLLKDFAVFVESQSSRLKTHAKALAEKAGRPYLYVTAPSLRKENLVAGIAARDSIRKGLICILSAVEPCVSYGLYKNRDTRRLELRRLRRKCLFLYFYFIDPRFGLMHVRLQTWFPFDIQVCLNGREWLARQMDREGIAYTRRDNCFAALADPRRAQTLADRQLDTHWSPILDTLARHANPLLRDLLKGFQYYWTVRQGEYATDVMFRNPPALADVYPFLAHHAITAFHAEDILRFLGQRLTGHFQGEVTSRFKKRPEGVCIRHGVRENSIKMYDKQGSVLRVETTINNPRRFKAYRWVTRNGQRVRLWVPLRKGLADLYRRVEISRAANARYLNALATVAPPQPAARVLDPVAKPVVTPTQRFRALRPIEAQEAALFTAILRGEHLLNGFRNADLRRVVFPQPTSDPDERRRRSHAVSHRLRLLRAHHLIHKLPGTTRYQVSLSGTRVMSTALALRLFDLSSLQKTA